MKHLIDIPEFSDTLRYTAVRGGEHSKLVVDLSTSGELTSKRRQPCYSPDTPFRTVIDRETLITPHNGYPVAERSTCV